MILFRLRPAIAKVRQDYVVAYTALEGWLLNPAPLKTGERTEHA
ncbi:hypothetical protein SAMN07250955_103300 [Arboricoccus pini]|uniref:Uncharacterized protein n=1 Tax=Arboricoccus pini TaxID=1963835 RepID=A0A212QUF4_9PROT|nr:hypothetical protein SAMN07250955_103300 [Arboricoccus pini]